MHAKIIAILLVCLTLLITGCSSSSSGSSSFEPRFAYVLNEDDPSVSWYRLDADSGKPRHAGYLYLGNQADSVFDLVLHPEGDALYISDPDGDQIHLLHADPVSGALRYSEALSTIADIDGLDSNFRPYGLAISSDGQHLYSVMQSAVATTRIFGIDEEDRSLSADAIYDVITTGLRELVISPDSRFLYASAPDDGALVLIELNAGGGQFEGHSAQSTDGPLIVRDMAFDANGERLVLVGERLPTAPAVHTLQVFAIAADGTLAFLNSMNAFIPENVSLAPDGRKIFVGGEGRVQIFSFNPDTNSLTAHGDPGAPMDTGVVRAMVDPSGQYLYAASSGVTRGEALQFARIEDIDPAQYSPRFGSLARPGPGRTVFSTGSPARVSATHLYAGDRESGSDTIERFALDGQGRPGQREAFAAGEDGIRGLAVHPQANTLFSANEGSLPTDNGRLMAFALDETGALDLPALDVIAGGAEDLDPLAMAISPGTRHVYTAGGGSFHYRAYNSDAQDFGTGGTFPRTFTTTGMTIDPSGRFLFEATTESDGRIRRSLLAVNSGAPGSAVTLDFEAVADVAVTPDGATLIAISHDETNPEIRAWSISPVDGTLTLNNTRSLADPGVAVVLHPSGRQAYVVSQRDTGGAQGDSTLALRVYPLDTDGQLAQASFEDEWTDTWRINMHSVAVSPDGRAVYVGTSDTDSGEGTLRVYPVNADDGASPSGPQLHTTVNIPAALAVRREYQ